MPNLTAAPAQLGATRLRNVDTFLATRGLDREGLGELLRSKTGEGGHVLLTSSPVHGIANPTSDIDLIRVEEHAVSGARMATQLFERDQHLEVISYGEAEVAAALADLASAATLDPAAVTLAHRAWDENHELRRKYLERIVNGVSLDGTSPYLDHLPALARVWKWSSLHNAVRHVLHLRLAEAAGETRGRAGYAFGALLYLVDAVLSHSGDVCSNRKWHLLRWRRCVDGGTADPAIGERIADLERRLAAALRGRSPEPLAPAFRAALGVVYAIAGEGNKPALVLEPATDASRLPFLPGAGMLVGRTGLFIGSELPAGPIAVSGGALPPGDPAENLRALRGGALRLLPA